MATAIALVGCDQHKFNSDFKLSHIVSLYENGSRPCIVVTDNNGKNIGNPYIPSLQSTFDDMINVILTNINVSNDSHINVIRLNSNSILRFDRSTYQKYSQFKNLKLYNEYQPI
jgi:hypothetical protein